MTQHIVSRTISILAGAILISSCSDSAFRSTTGPVEPAAVQSSGASASRHGLPTSGTLELKALWWRNAHRDVIRVSKTIGVDGGTISMPETGLTMVFPAGAVGAPLTITVTSDDRYVAYKMEPSGTTFSKDVVVTQQLSFTEVAGAPLRTQLFAAYIADDNLQLSGKVPVLEVEPSTTTLSSLTSLPQAQTWLIRHFSRYMLASG
jgi:hypothetical protein